MMVFHLISLNTITDIFYLQLQISSHSQKKIHISNNMHTAASNCLSAQLKIHL